jgi:hypothetical protein
MLNVTWNVWQLTGDTAANSFDMASARTLSVWYRNRNICFLTRCAEIKRHLSNDIGSAMSYAMTDK